MHTIDGDYDIPYYTTVDQQYLYSEVIMVDFNSEEDIRELLKLTHRPSLPSIEFKERLRNYLMNEAASLSYHQSILKRPKLWALIVGACALGATGYGIWQSLNLVPTLLL